MTTRGEPPLSRVVTFAAHAIPYVIVSAVAVRIASLIGLIPLYVWIVLEIATLTSFVALFIHKITGALCLRCIRDSPLNPELSVRQNKYFLRFEHRTFKQWMLIYMVCLICSIVPTNNGIMSVALALPMDVLLFTQMWGFWIHHRLQPWCPYCRGWDEGGDEELVPDPDPAASRTR